MDGFKQKRTRGQIIDFQFMTKFASGKHLLNNDKNKTPRNPFYHFLMSPRKLVVPKFNLMHFAKRNH